MKKDSFNQATRALKQHDEYLKLRGDLPFSAPSPKLDALKTLALLYAKKPDHPVVHENESLYPELAALRGAYGIPEMIRRMEMAIAKDDFRPKDMRLLDFAASPDLDSITDDFCTFDINVSRAYRKYKHGLISKDELRRINTASITNAFEVVTQYEKDWSAILAAHPKYTRQLITRSMDIPTKKLTKILTTFMMDMYKRQSIIPANPHLLVVDDWDEAPTGWIPDKIKKSKTISGFHTYIELGGKWINLICLNRRKHKATDSLSMFIELMKSLAHEYGHVIDRCVQLSVRGMLGQQRATIDREIYQENTDGEHKQEYQDSATETSSYDIGDHLAFMLNRKYNSGK